MVRFIVGAAMLPLALVFVIGGTNTGSEQAAAQEKKKAADLFGRIAAVSEDGKQITVESKKKGEAEVKKTDVKITADTKIEFVGVEDAEKKLKVGYFAAVMFVEGSKDTAASIKAGMAKKKAAN
jgi:hypothetical protein